MQVIIQKQLRDPAAIARFLNEHRARNRIDAAHFAARWQDAEKEV
jgi:hypothetical protein